MVTPAYYMSFMSTKAKCMKVMTLSMPRKKLHAINAAFEAKRASYVSHQKVPISPAFINPSGGVQLLPIN